MSGEIPAHNRIITLLKRRDVDYSASSTVTIAQHLVNTLTVRGHPHHYAVGQGNTTRELMKFAAWMKARLIEKIPYADYVQIGGVNV